MEQKRFKMRDEKFICENCGFDVKELGYTARDHCPNCLYSKHVDINPGDRSSECGGLLEPIGIEKFKKGYKMIYKCKKCGCLKRNIIAKDDNIDLIIDIMSRPVDINNI